MQKPSWFHMSSNQSSRQFPNTIFVAFALVFVIVFSITNAHASLEDDFRRQLIKEVSLAVEDKSLVDGIVEIRFRREFEKWKGTSSEVPTSAVNMVVPNEKKKKSSDVFSQLVNKNFGSSASVNTGIGNVGFFGFSYYLNPNARLRADLTANKSTGNTELIRSNSYLVEKSIYSLGTYIDWHPFQNGFKFTAGINVNRMEQKVTSLRNSTITVNGKNALAGNNYLDIAYKFPKVTPYFGFGYESGTGNDFGWNGIAELGVMVGRYDAEAKTNLLGESNITLEDLNLEIDANRNALFKSRYQPIVKIGLKYGY